MSGNGKGDDEVVGIIKKFFMKREKGKHRKITIPINFKIGIRF